MRSVSLRLLTCVHICLRLCGSRPSVGSSRKRTFGVCRRPRAISRRRGMAPEEGLTKAARRAVEHAVDFHVLPGRQVLVEAWVLKDDAEALTNLVSFDHGV